MSDLLITHVDVLTDEGVLKNHAIAINNGYITAILNDSEATKVKDNTTNDFNNLLDKMNKALGINPNAMQNPGTMSNTNKNTNTDTKK